MSINHMVSDHSSIDLFCLWIKLNKVQHIPITPYSVKMGSSNTEVDMCELVGLQEIYSLYFYSSFFLFFMVIFLNRTKTKLAMTVGSKEMF